MKLIKIYLVLFLTVLSMVGCGQGDAFLLGPKWIDDVHVIVEIRPGAPTVGMNEFLVIATQKDRRPAHQYIVSIKMKNANQWRQSIQDGESGVYRRAIRVIDPIKDVLLVKFESKDGSDKVVELIFPLSEPFKP